jgi:ubiquinone/menaquinone biosynthesis C-methylase UbiE
MNDNEHDVLAAFPTLVNFLSSIDLLLKFGTTVHWRDVLERRVAEVERETGMKVKELCRLAGAVTEQQDD